jgi:hypothetical protein
MLADTLLAVSAGFRHFAAIISFADAIAAIIRALLSLRAFHAATSLLFLPPHYLPRMPFRFHFRLLILMFFTSYLRRRHAAAAADAAAIFTP